MQATHQSFQGPTESSLTFTRKDISLFRGKLQMVFFRSGDYLLRQGETENYIYFLLSGVLKEVLTNDRKPICTNFAVSGNIFCSFASFSSHQPSHFDVQALSDVTAARVHYSTVQELYESSPQHERFGRQLAEAFYTEGFNRELLFAGLNAEDRYRRLAQRRPELFRHVALKDLAAYLGIYPQSLSRLRRKLYKVDDVREAQLAAA